MTDTTALATALDKLLDRHDRFEGTATELLALLDDKHGINHPNHLTALLRRHLGEIEAAGISVMFCRSRNRLRRRLIRITRTPSSSSVQQPVAPVTPQQPRRAENAENTGHVRIAALPIYGSTRT